MKGLLVFWWNFTINEKATNYSNFQLMFGDIFLQIYGRNITSDWLSLPYWIYFLLRILYLLEWEPELFLKRIGAGTSEYADKFETLNEMFTLTSVNKSIMLANHKLLDNILSLGLIENYSLNSHLHYDLLRHKWTRRESQLKRENTF